MIVGVFPAFILLAYKKQRLNGFNYFSHADFSNLTTFYFTQVLKLLSTNG